jgi:hypothetical protein
VVGGDHELEIFVLHLLVFGEGDAGGEVDVAVEVVDVGV